MMTTTITIHDKTKDRIVSYGKMTETYDDVINRLFDEVDDLKEIIQELGEHEDMMHEKMESDALGVAINNL